METTVMKYPEQKINGKNGKIVSHGKNSRYHGLHTAYVGVKPIGDFKSLEAAKAKLDSLAA